MPFFRTAVTGYIVSMNLERITVEFHAEEDRLMKLVQDTTVKADWDISLAVPTFTHAPAGENCARTVN